MFRPLLKRLFVLNREILISKSFCSSIATQDLPVVSLPAIKREDYRHGRKYATDELQKLLQLDRLDALKIAVQYDQLQKCTVKRIRDNYNLLRGADIPNETILKHPDLLSLNGLKKKLNTLKSLPFEIRDTVVLSNLNGPLQLNKLEHQIKFLSDLFGLPVSEICDDISRRQFMLKLSPAKIERNFELLKKYNITIEELRRDLWILLYSSEIIAERLRIARNLRVDKLKTWMVRVPEKTFYKSIQRVRDNKLILGNNSIAEYLVGKLGCSVEDSTCILQKYPPLLNKNMRKLDQIIDTLFAEGLTKRQITLNPKILLHSIDTTVKRLRELIAKGAKTDNCVHIIIKSQKNYRTYLESLEKANKNKESETST